MLSRTADHLYWMSRYTERAENIARMLEVSYRMSLQTPGSQPGYWGAALGINGLEEAYRSKYGAITAGNVLRFMSVDLDNPSSILACLRAARENCHAVRGTVTSEVWETVNTTWLEARDSVQSLPQGSIQGSELTKYFEWVKFRSHLSRGVTVGTMLQDEAFHFIRLGTFLERADNTARLLDVKFDELAPPSSADGEYYEWSALLRSVSAFEIYRKVYRDMITPQRVA
ncbi:MAG: alpha-E domain-containing protein, partial [Burkholderiaceae bacterium]|nr:alpha-E domain-containing protein [Burkholderiaceae bacterium]